MEPTTVLPWLFAALLVIVHFFGEQIARHERHAELTSFATGVTVTYIFLQLLPEHHKGIEHLGEFGWFSALIGFSLLHAIEKYIYGHEKSVEQIRHDFKELHSSFLFAYYTMIGVILTYLVQRDVVHGTLFFIPVFLHTTISSLSLTELHDDIVNNRFVHMAIINAVVLGVLAATLVPIGPAMFHILLGVLTGMFLYIIIHDSMAQKTEGYVFSFLLGTVLYSGVIVYLWIIG